MIRHVVTWKLSATDEATRVADAAAIVAVLAALPPLVPSIRALTVGPNMLHPGVNWDVVLVVDFDDVAGLAAYQVHPDHVAVANTIGPRVTQKVTADIEI
jgi:hypothetical protein